MLTRFTYLLLVVFYISCSSDTRTLDKTEVLTWPHGKTGAISITYDDATINQFRQAMLIMDTLNLKGTFFINTADIPGSTFAPKYFGRPLPEVVRESAIQPTDSSNLFERASALRFLNLDDAVELHNSAGALFEQGKFSDAYKVVDDALARARKLSTIKETRPILLTGELITWDELRRFAANGHEFGNHTISHPRLAVLTEENLLYELEKCKEEISNQLGAAHTFSAECPFGTEDERVMEYAYRIHPALRNRMPSTFLQELNRWNPDPPGKFKASPYVQWQRGPLKKHGVQEMKSWVDTLLQHNNVWLVLTFHGVDDIGWEAKPHEELKAYFTYMKTHEDRLWVATFGDVTKYIRERMGAIVNVKRDNDATNVSVSHSLGDTYDIPLTLRTYVDQDWQKVRVRQGQTSLTIVPQKNDQGTYVIYEVRPNGEPVTITELSGD